MPNQQLNIKNSIFPEGSGLIISGLVQKYGLEEIEKKVIQKIKEMEDPGERERIAEELPGRIIARIVKETAEGKLPIVSFTSELKGRLGLKNEAAKDLTKELEEKLLKEVEFPRPQEYQKPKRSDIYLEPIG